METDIRVSNPFIEHLQPHELLVWVAQPDKIVYTQRSWRYFRGGAVFGCFVTAACALGLLFPDDRFQRAFCIFFLIILPIILAMGLYFTVNSYRYAPWYALTDRHVLVAILDEGSFVVRKTELSNIKSISVNKTCPEVGTVMCRCHYLIVSLMSKTMRLEHINEPDAIAELILEAKQRMFAH